MFNWHNEDSKTYSLDNWCSKIQILQNLPDEEFRYEDILEDLNDEVIKDLYQSINQHGREVDFILLIN